MEIPDELKHRIALFKDFGRSNQVEGELFRLDSWTQVMLGQGIMPSSYHPIVGLMPDRDLQNFLNSIAADVDKSIAMMSTHQDFVNKYSGVL
jgi:tryptophan halogenase